MRVGPVLGDSGSDDVSESGGRAVGERARGSRWFRVTGGIEEAAFVLWTSLVELHAFLPEDWAVLVVRTVRVRVAANAEFLFPIVAIG